MLSNFVKYMPSFSFKSMFVSLHYCIICVKAVDLSKQELSQKINCKIANMIFACTKMNYELSCDR